MYSSTFSALALVAASLLTSVVASGSNFTLRTTGTTVSATCGKVSGTAYGSKFNFGCLCLDDVDDFCGNNGLNSYFQKLIYSYIQQSGKTFNYPSNAQPICDGNGGYDCGSLSKLSNGQCGNQNSNVCPPSQCFSNGGCCPRGQTYSNGKCCGSNGCDRNGQTCTPALSCSTYKDNNICCPAGTSGWKGQKSRCCPVGQIESADGTDCVCPAGKKQDPKDENKCTEGCPTDCKWGATQCCPNTATEKNGVCVCPTGQTLSADKTKCTNTCESGHKWCNTKCCPPGSDEDATGKCVCTDKQSTLSSDGKSCVDRCPNGNWGGSVCCSADAKEIAGKCVCTDTSKTYTGSGSTGSCTSSCPPGCLWGPKQRACCPAKSTENDQGVCICDDSTQKIVNGVCTSKCPTGQTLNPTTQTCCAAGTTVVNGACSCPSTSQVLTNGKCVDRCANNWVYGPNVPGQCCPPGSKPNTAGTACVCNDPSQQISGSGSSQTCSTKCQPGCTWGSVSKTCCPVGAIEVGGVCQCTDNTQTIKGSGDDAKCVGRCPTNWTWGAMGKRCCPPGSSEDYSGNCKCTDKSKSITGSGDSQTCSDRCSDKGSGWSWCTSRCCPAGSTEKNGVCDCDDDSQTLSPDGSKCIDQCPDGQRFAGSRCCPTDAYQVGNTCQCNKWYLGYTLSSDGTKCTPSCLWGYKFQDTKCCRDYLDEKNGQCVCPNDGDKDNGNSCQPSCPSGKTYNSATKSCDTVCASGFTYKKGWKGDAFCCTNSETACNTRCCPAPLIEIGQTGVCCAEGSQVVNGKCVGASPAPYHKRRSTVGDAILLTKQSSLESFFGIEGNKNGKLCPMGMAACPIEGRDQAEYECIDAQSDLQSCGGCASMGTGEDCSAIPGARWMGCNVGKCEVYSCKAGWSMVEGRCQKK